MRDALLPADLPVVPCLDVAGRYLLAPDSAAGGDWFDAVVRPDGRVALVTGDVVGHGIGASAVMGQLRAVLHEHLITDEPLTAALSALDRYARVQPESRAATVCLAEIDPRTGSVEYCTAGHPPPLVVTATGHTRFLAPTGAGPLADRCRAGRHPARPARAGGPPSPLQRRPAPPARDDRHAQQGRAGQRRRGRSDRATTRRCVGPGGRPRLRPHPGPARPRRRPRRRHHRAGRTPGAAAASLLGDAAGPTVVGHPDARCDGRLARALELRPIDDMAVHHALDELMANVVNHAYVDASAGQRTVWVHAELDAHGDLVCTVGDSGRWQPPGPSGDGGRGLALVRGLVDSLRLAARAGRHDGDVPASPRPTRQAAVGHAGGTARPGRTRPPGAVLGPP